MARIGGRNATMYANITSAGTAEPVAFLSSWELSAVSDRFEVTAFGDTTKTYVAGLPDATGSYSGFYDNATAQTFTAALDGVARKVYLYPDRTNTGQYFWGTAFLDFSVSGEVNGATEMSGSWSAATPFAKVG